MKKILFCTLFILLIFSLVGCDVDLPFDLPNGPWSTGTPTPDPSGTPTPSPTPIIIPEAVEVTTIAGGGSNGWTSGKEDGTGTSALFSVLRGIAIASDGSIYVSDMGNNKIRKINPATGQVITIAGGGTDGVTSGKDDGTGTSALFNGPVGIAIASNGNIYVVDDRNYKIRMITSTSPYTVSTVAGGGETGDENGKPSDSTYNDTNSLFYYPGFIAIDIQGSFYVTEGSNRIRKMAPSTYQLSTIDGYYSGPSGIAFAADGSIYLVESWSHTIRKITLAPYSSAIIAGGGSNGRTPGRNDGIGTNALFNNPNGIAIGSDGSIYVADSDNNRIRKINPITYQVTTIAGGGSTGDTPGSNDGTGTSARFNFPVGLAFAADGSIYVTDSDNGKIRKISFN